MKSYCDYHPIEPARWLCPQCQSFYCKSCTPGTIPTCPDCKVSLENLGSSNEVVPFWDRLPEFFKYCVSGGSLLIVLAMTITMAMFEPSIGSGIMLMLVFSAQTLYGFSILKHTAEGELTPPNLMSMFEGNVRLLFRSILWFLGLGLLAASGFFLDPKLGIATSAFVGFVYPASAILYVHESSVRAAINPLRLIDFVWKTRSGYVVLFIHLALITMASGAAQEWVASWAIHPMVDQGVAGFFTAYFGLMVYSFSGYFLLQYQRQLGLVATIHDDEEEEEDPLHMVKLRIKQGQFENAVSAMESLCRQQPQNETWKYYLWELLLQTGEYEKLAPNADAMTRRMLSTHRFKDMLPFIRFMLQERPNGFEELATRVSLAKELVGAGQEKWAYALLKSVHQLYPYDPKRLDALRLLANVLGALGQKAQADKVLKYVASQSAPTAS